MLMVEVGSVGCCKGLVSEWKERVGISLFVKFCDMYEVEIYLERVGWVDCRCVG